MMMGGNFLRGAPLRGIGIGTGSRFPRPVRSPQTPTPFEGPDMQRPRGGPVMGPVLGSFKKGGKVKKTGLYKLHKGERVAPVSNLLRAR